MASASAHDQTCTLPLLRDALIGREQELATARALVLDEAVPVLTLTGPGGVGKTRLALATGHAVANAFADGVAFVELASLADSTLVPAAVATAVGTWKVAERPLPEQLAAILRPRQLLLVLDNCEHLLTAVANLVTALLAACPALQVLVTSRAPLHIRGEHEAPVSPLTLPAVGDDVASIGHAASVELFVRRAHATDPTFALTPANAAAVAEVCRRLDGLPLALELAAAWSKVLPPVALLNQITHRRLDLPGEARDRPARQRTIGATIGWSYDLLRPEEQSLFRRLAVFAGGFTLEAAQAVVGTAAGDVLRSVAALVDQGLLTRTMQPDGTARFGMLETVREFGLERLAADSDEGNAHDRHADHYLALAEAAWPPRRITPVDPTAQVLLETERANFRAALAWTTERGKSETALRLVATLAQYWYWRCDLTEGQAWMERALGMEITSRELRAKLLCGAGILSHGQGACGDARRRAEESLALAEADGDLVDMARAEITCSLAANCRGDTAAAITHASAALTLAQQADDAHFATWAITRLGVSALRQGEWVQAIALLGDAIARFAAVGDLIGEANAAGFLASSLVHAGEHGRAAEFYRRGLTLHRQVDAFWGFVYRLTGVAALAAAAGLAEPASRLLGAAESLMGADWLSAPELQEWRVQARATALADLGPELFASAVKAGRRLEPDAAVADALAVLDILEATGTDHHLRLVPAHPPVAVPDDHFDLTRREREVLVLLCQRLTDKEIAAHLFVAPRTARFHVENVLAKLGVTNRRAAAALAVHHGLT